MDRHRRGPRRRYLPRRDLGISDLPRRSRRERIFRTGTQEEKKKKEKNFLRSAFIAFFVILIANRFFPDVIPFDTFELWEIKSGNWLDWLVISWPIFAWGGGITLFVSIVTLNTRKQNLEAEKLFLKGTIISIGAGVLEEISFRWLIFISGIVGLKIANFLFFGWAGFGISEWFEIHVSGLVANFFTLGYLSDILSSPENWAIGAAMLAANAFFRNGHKYLGFFGYVNSWFIGMFMFWLLFQYGLLACILVHFAYDFLIFTVRYLDMVVERGMGWNKAAE